MSTKSKKISFNTFNAGKVSFISRSEIAQANERVKAAMKDVIREYEKNETVSLNNAAKLILNR